MLSDATVAATELVAATVFGSVVSVGAAGVLVGPVGVAVGDADGVAAAAEVASGGSASPPQAATIGAHDANHVSSTLRVRRTPFLAV